MSRLIFRGFKSFYLRLKSRQASFLEKLEATLASFVNAGKFVDYGGSAGF